MFKLLNYLPGVQSRDNDVTFLISILNVNRPVTSSSTLAQSYFYGGRERSRGTRFLTGIPSAYPAAPQQREGESSHQRGREAR